MATGTPVPGPPAQKRTVAGSFLFRYPDGDEKAAQVALFRRSHEVRSYQNKLAPLSGSVESDDPTPLAAAWREIKEETTLGPESLQLLRIGKPYSFTDSKIGREWSINPFAFRLKDPAEGGKGEQGIRIDWEHQGWEWHDPLEVNESEEFGGVPKLVDSLRRVWPEYDLGRDAGEALTTGLRRLQDDHASGARELVKTALSILKEVVSAINSAELNAAWWANVRMAAWHIWKNGRESMGAAIASNLVLSLQRIERIYSADLPDADKIRLILEELEGQIAERDVTIQNIRHHFRGFAVEEMAKGEGARKALSVLTLSSSSTILHCLRELVSAGVAVDLRILESRPNFEGVSFAARLAAQLGQEAANVTTSLYTDAAAAIAAENVDTVLLGADHISSLGDVSNKVGSLPAVLSARAVSPNVKVMVVGEVEKVGCRSSPGDHAAEENDPHEITKDWPSDVYTEDTPAEVKNIYFEWVPARLIDGYITDDGLWSKQQIAQKSEEIEREMDRFFLDL